MVSLKKAMSIAEKNVPNFKVKNVSENSAFFVINMIPKNIEKSGIFGEYMDSSFKVDKKTGKIETYNPLLD